MNIVDLLEFILIFVIGICFYLSKAKDMLKKKNEIKNIDFRPLTQEEEKKYRKFSNIVIIECFVVFILVTGIWYYFFQKNGITLIIYIIVTIMCFLPYVLLFFGKPLGIKTGKLTHVKGFGVRSYTVYFNDIEKYISDIEIFCINHMNVRKNDKCQIVKSSFGFLYAFRDVNAKEKSNEPKLEELS